VDFLQTCLRIARIVGRPGGAQVLGGGAVSESGVWHGLLVDQKRAAQLFWYGLDGHGWMDGGMHACMQTCA
jgi:hypothetical protein